MLTTDQLGVAGSRDGLVARRVVLGAGIALFVTALAGCGREAVGGLDTYRPADRAFFEPLRLEGAIRAGNGAQSLEELVKGSLAVVQDKISEVTIAAVSPEKDGTGSLSTIGLVLAAPQLLKGRLPDFAKTSLTVVGGTATESVDQELAQLRDSLPKGEAIWFLNSIASLAEERRVKLEALDRKPTPEDLKQTAALGSLFVAGPHSVIIQGESGLDMPYLVDDDYMFRDALGDDIKKLRSMSELRAAVVAIR